MLLQKRGCAAMNNHNTPMRSLIGGRLPRTISGEADLFDPAEPEHLIDALSPMYNLAPWEIRKLFDELARRNPPPHPREGVPHGPPGPHSAPEHRT